MKYFNIDTGEIFTLEDVKDLYQQFRWEMDDPIAPFEDYLEEQLSQGRQKIGGLIEIDTCYLVVDDCTTKRASIWDKKFPTEQEAVEYAESEWDSLTEHDKKDRDAYYVASAELDEDGEIDWNTVDSIKEFK